MRNINCDNSYRCSNHDSKYCYECKENKGLESYFDDTYKYSCHDSDCIHNVGYQCRIKSIVENEGYGCLESEYEEETKC